METLMENPEAVAGSVVAIGAALWMLFKAVAKITKTKVDDSLVDMVEGVKEEIKDADK